MITSSPFGITLVSPQMFVFLGAPIGLVVIVVQLDIFCCQLGVEVVLGVQILEHCLVPGIILWMIWAELEEICNL